MTCLGVAGQSQLGGVIGNEAGKAVKGLQCLAARVWTLKGRGQSRPLRAGKGHDCAYFRKMILTVVWMEHEPEGERLDVGERI